MEMSKTTKRPVDDIEFDSSSIKRICRNITCLFDLPDEIFLLICRYLSPAYVLCSFYTPWRPEMRLHRIILDYYTEIKLDGIQNNEYVYLTNLFCDRKIPLRPESLILSNEHVTCLTRRYFNCMDTNVIDSIFMNLRSLTLIDCSLVDLEMVAKFYFDMTQIEYFHINLRRIDNDIKLRMIERCDTIINQCLFGGRICSLHEVILDAPDGLTLYKTLIPNQSLTHIDLVLETIDDLYVLLDGLVPNIEKMIIQLRRSRILSRLRPQSTPSCPRLTKFTLLEPAIGFVVDDIKSILGYMPSLIKLTLSIRDTPDPTFSHGPKFESMLIEYLPNLRQFDYTMTYTIVDQGLIEDFILWPMSFSLYESENCKWIHIYSLPWPSSKDDKRQLPIVKDGCNTLVISDVKRAEYMDHVMITKQNEFIELKRCFRRARQITTCLSIDMNLPERISKVVLTKQTPITSIQSIVQPCVRHLIVERRLNDEREIALLARQFPNVQYLKLLFPLEKFSFLRCFQTLFNVDESIDANRRLWYKLINFSIELFDNNVNVIFDDTNIHRWLIRNTDLKFVKSRFYVNVFNSVVSIWF